MLKSIQPIVILAFLGATQAQSEVILGSSFASGNWQGEAYTNDVSGKFSHCAISAPYESGDTLIFGVTRAATVTVGVVAPGLRMTEGDTFPVILQVDGRSTFQAVGAAASSDVAYLEIEDFRRALNAFKRGYTLDIFALGAEGNFSLAGTFRALDAATRCATRYFDYSSPRRPEAPQTSQIDPALTYQIATSMITELGLSDARYLTKAELNEIDLAGSAYWVSETTGVEGGAMLFDLSSDAPSIRETDITVSEYLSRGCLGDVATMAKSVEGEFPARQVRVLCVDDDSTRESYATTTDVGSIRLISVLRFDAPQAAGEDTSRGQVSADLALKNASYVLENE
ncbi:hypothetical protein G5B39_12265 [Rhodobacteraceae bacterium SC52]|nr:hypothetical protein G5B39_12265 [Rhodobacteraceae bacterium SC52]